LSDESPVVSFINTRISRFAFSYGLGLGGSAFFPLHDMIKIKNISTKNNFENSRIETCISLND
jgi:hypothetical protein